LGESRNGKKKAGLQEDRASKWNRLTQSKKKQLALQTVEEERKDSKSPGPLPGGKERANKCVSSCAGRLRSSGRSLDAQRKYSGSVAGGRRTGKSTYFGVEEDFEFLREKGVAAQAKKTEAMRRGLKSADWFKDRPTQKGFIRERR